MTLDWLIIGAISLGILTIIMMMVAFVAMLRASATVKQLSAAKPKGRKAKKKWQRQLKRATKSRQKKLRTSVALLITSMVIGGVGGYAKYYQMTNMTAKDTENIVTGYYLLNQMTEQLNELADGAGNEEKMTANIQTLAVRMASFTSKKGSSRGTKESQLLLNRYYARMGQLGVNLSSQKASSLKEDTDTLTDYVTDVERVQAAQQKVLSFYKIDEKSLAEKQ